jgi:HEAT repeat protein
MLRRLTALLIGGNFLGVAWSGTVWQIAGIVLSSKPVLALAQDAEDQQSTAAVAALAGALSDPDVEVRRNAVLSLGRFGEDAAAAVPALTGALKDADLDVRGAAIVALGRIGRTAKTSVPELILSLQDSDADIRGAAALALGRMAPDSSAALPALAELAGEKDKRVQV